MKYPPPAASKRRRVKRDEQEVIVWIKMLLPSLASLVNQEFVYILGMIEGRAHESGLVWSGWFVFPFQPFEISDFGGHSGHNSPFPPPVGSSDCFAFRLSMPVAMTTKRPSYRLSVVR